ncbi:hypothetical protein [Streptomyces sp. NPDC059743]|uniref:hypothetical protein n=1 Tax=Streptomyces sp. NPDC059743 TaxID=3346928 RepID=UPI00365AE3B4
MRHTVGKGLVWDHLDLNVSVPHLRDAVLRRALFTAVDRVALIAETIGRRFVPYARPLGSHNFVQGMPDCTCCRTRHAQWNRIGVRTDIVPMSRLGSVLDAGDYDAVLFGWNANPVRVGPARDMCTGGE